MEKCKSCIHEKVCALWRAQECQDARSYGEDENGNCDYFQDKSLFVQVPRELMAEIEQRAPCYLAIRTMTPEECERHYMGKWVVKGEGNGKM